MNDQIEIEFSDLLTEVTYQKYGDTITYSQRFWPRVNESVDIIETRVKGGEIRITGPVMRVAHKFRDGKLSVNISIK